jgi:hypothetical protein
MRKPGVKEIFNVAHAVNSAEKIFSIVILLDIALCLCYFIFEEVDKPKSLSLQKGIPAAIGFRLEAA